MKLGVFTINGRTLLGEIDGETIYGIAWPDANMRGLIQRGITPSRAYERFPLADAVIRPPIQPGKIIAVGKRRAAASPNARCCSPS